ncbi:phage tail tape measure protein [Clostridium botulinum]|uniref:phage tail tape measure protein n=1 Tax=Clostridium botulinum TaxID=1491 RepID=UPI001C9B3036|nr:phage tail tape measure protein [Clostridium botulinum]MBY6874537.1 phage tail tape measure protein [Clostridium botulinum]
MASNTEKRITAKMVLDSTGYNDKLKGLNAEMKKHQAELKLASQGIKSFGKDSEKLKSVQESLSKQVELHSKKVDMYKKSIEKANSKMKENIKTRDKIKDSLDKANRKYEEAVKIYGKESTEAKKAKDEVNKLSEEHKKAEKAVETNAKQVQNYETNMNKANAEMTKAKGNLNKVNDELSKSNNKWLNASDKLKDHSEKLKKTGSEVSGVGDKILKLSAPIAAAGIASAKLGTDFNEAMSTVSTLIPGQQKRLQDLKGSVQDVAIATGKGTDDIANGTYQVISAFGDASDTMEKVEINAKSATAGMATTTDALNLSSAVMKGYGDTTAKANEKVMDMSFMTVKLGQTDFPSLASSIGKVVPLSNELKVSQEEMFTVFATGTGVTGTASEVSTQYRGILQSLMAPTKDMTSLIEEMGFKDGKAMMEKKGLAGTIELITKKAKETNTPLQKYIGSIEGQTLALALAGEQSGVYKDKLEQMKHSQGAMNEAFKEQTEGINKTGFAYKQAMVKMQVAGQKMGDAMAPILEKGAELFTKLADKLGSLSKEQLESIAKWGMFSIATGGALKVVGGGISTIGNIAGGLSKLTGWLGKTSTATKVVEGTTKGASAATKIAGEAMTSTAGKAGLLSKALGGIKGAGGLAAGGVTKLAATLGMSVPGLGLAAAGVAAVGYGAYKLHQNMKKDAVPSVDLFDKKLKTTKTTMDQYGNKITTTATKTVNFTNQTKKAVGQFVKDSDKVNKTVFNLCANQTKITAKTAKDVTQQYVNMSNQIKQAEDTKYKERLTSFKEFLNNNKDMSDEDKAQALQKMQDAHNKQQQQTDNYTKRIAQILDNARNNNREITAQEQQEINSIQEKMKTEGIKKLSTSEQESKTILSRLKQYGTRITAEQASDIIKNAEKQRSGSVNKANQQYNQTVAQIKKMRDEDHSITADQANKMIKEAERQKKGSIEKAEQHKNGVVKQIKKMSSDTLKDIDTTDGHIMTKWEKLKSWFANNPIVRWIKSKTSGDPEPQKKWTGDRYFSGGLTYLHDAPGRNSNYELYDLPRGTRIFNHDASQELVMQTAESVASKVANSVLKGFNGANGISVTQHIYSPTPSASELARQSKNNLRELALQW